MPGNSVNSRCLCLDNLGNSEYSSLPMFMIVIRSSDAIIDVLAYLYIKAHKLVGTHCCPAFVVWIVLLGSTNIGPGFVSMSPELTKQATLYHVIQAFVSITDSRHFWVIHELFKWFTFL